MFSSIVNRSYLFPSFTFLNYLKGNTLKITNAWIRKLAPDDNITLYIQTSGRESFMGRKHSESPPRGRGSPRRRSPSRRERSPARHRSSKSTRSEVAEKTSSRNRSPRRPRSGSPVSRSPEREKLSNRTKSPRRRKSNSPPARSPVREKPTNHTRSTRQAKSRSPESRSPSPRTKRLRGAHGERETTKVSERGHDKNQGKQGDGSSHRERDIDKEMSSDRRDRRSGRHGIDNGSSRSRHGRSVSPSVNHRRSRHRSRSPAADKRARDEVSGDSHSLTWFYIYMPWCLLLVF